MRNSIDFKKIEVDGELVGVLNFNLMIPVEDAQLHKIDTVIRMHDNADTKRKKERLIKELKWCNEQERDLVNTARVLYEKYRLKEHFSARAQCIDFMRMEEACKNIMARRKDSRKKRLYGQHYTGKRNPGRKGLESLYPAIIQDAVR